MAQSIFVHIGQCGNQIGHKFWEAALKEHSFHNKSGLFDDSMASFFRNIDDTGYDKKVGAKIESLRARAVLFDMEEGVVNQISRSEISELFDDKQLLTSVSGSGNNWATGYHKYGKSYKDEILNSLRQCIEHCDHQTCFFTTHSMGGGTGSGFGSYTLQLIKDNYPKTSSIVLPVYPSPSQQDDVITSPYNCTLATKILTHEADLVFPIENRQLFSLISQKNESIIRGISKPPRKPLKTEKEDIFKSTNPFDSINNIISDILLDITASSRFEGCLNMDLGELTVNLVPFPKLHYPILSKSPIFNTPRKVDECFSDLFSNSSSMCNFLPSTQKNSIKSLNFSKVVHAKTGNTFSCAIVARGKIDLFDVNRNLKKILEKRSIFTIFSQDCWKSSICNAKGLNLDYSIVAIRNTSDVVVMFEELASVVKKLFKRRAHLHHYINVAGMEVGEIGEAIDSLDSLINEYKDAVGRGDAKESIMERKKYIVD